MLQKCFGEYTLSRKQVFEMHKTFNETREVIERLPHGPSTSVKEENTEVFENHRLGIRELAEYRNISYGSTKPFYI